MDSKLRKNGIQRQLAGRQLPLYVCMASALVPLLSASQYVSVCEAKIAGPNRKSLPKDLLPICFNLSF